MRFVFHASRKVIENFDSIIQGVFWKIVRFAVAVCKLEINLGLIV